MKENDNKKEEKGSDKMKTNIGEEDKQENLITIIAIIYMKQMNQDGIKVNEEIQRGEMKFKNSILSF